MAERRLGLNGIDDEQTMDEALSHDTAQCQPMKARAAIAVRYPSWNTSYERAIL
jgi:hypothetical protein